MNIGDYLKFDDRAREYLNRFYAKKINEVSNKYIGCGALAIEKIYEIEKQRDSEIKRHKESGLPPTNMWQMYAIEWGEANPGMTFDQALRDCYAYAKAPIVGIDLLSGEGSISIKEAKEMFGYSNNEPDVSPELLEQSLRILHNDIPVNNTLNINYCGCRITINNETHEIPIFWIKYIIAKANNPDIEFSKETVDKIKKIVLPDIHAEWPR